MKKNIVFTLLVICLIISCSTEDSNNDENNIPEHGKNLVKRQYYDLLEDDQGYQRNNIDYSYNQNNLLIRVYDSLTKRRMVLYMLNL